MIELAMALQRIGFLRCTEQNELLELLSCLDDLRHIGARDMLRMVGRKYQGQQFDAGQIIAHVHRDMEWMPQLGIRPLYIWGIEYPALLREISDPPVVVYVRGNLPDRPYVSVVGTRHPTTEGRHAAYRLGFELARMGYAVVSGLAMGTDAEAHAGAVDGGGETLAVLASGVDTVTPRSNTYLASQMLAQDGGLLSEFPVGTEASKFRFPQRNRIIAGIAAMTIVVEAPRNSGALITADFAHGVREVLVHRVGYESPLGDGSRELVYSGARLLREASELMPAVQRESDNE